MSAPNTGNFVAYYRVGTKAALAAAKARGVKLGDNRSVPLTPEARQTGCERRKAIADKRASTSTNHHRGTGKRRDDAASHRGRPESVRHPGRKRSRRVAAGAARRVLARL